MNFQDANNEKLRTTLYLSDTLRKFIKEKGEKNLHNGTELICQARAIVTFHHMYVV